MSNFPNINIKNLIKLRNFIRDHVKDEQFDMSSFRSKPWMDIVVSCAFEDFNHCGTIGCALGWLPFAVPEILDDRRMYSLTFDGEKRVLDFADVSSEYLGISETEEVWDYLFSAMWKRHSPTRQDFIDRVNKLLLGEATPRYIKKVIDEVYGNVYFWQY